MIKEKGTGSGEWKGERWIGGGIHVGVGSTTWVGTTTASSRADGRPENQYCAPDCCWPQHLEAREPGPLTSDLQRSEPAGLGPPLTSDPTPCPTFVSRFQAPREANLLLTHSRSPHFASPPRNAQLAPAFNPGACGYPRRRLPGQNGKVAAPKQLGSSRATQSQLSVTVRGSPAKPRTPSLLWPRKCSPPPHTSRAVPAEPLHLHAPLSHSPFASSWPL